MTIGKLLRMFARRRKPTFVVLLALAALGGLIAWREVRAHRMETALIEAVKRGDVAEVRRLLDAGANVEARSRSYPDGPGGLYWRWRSGTPIYRGLTPLMLAAIAGDERLAAILLEKGANVNATEIDDGQGDTALSLAAAYGRQKMVAFLLAHGAHRQHQSPGRAGEPNDGRAP